ncbi:hypothetical protein Ahy_B03g064334 [Arachis hypogaea]|uniref:Replication factor A C-terminal domain-containing protein n=1 Tax=Arachis hypogaea TaxID=3818 RepID=A0A444ZZD7_ARAHY|nr:hypothetical protein Ahy_B03g064334 [Arachis hypogaea]
MYTMSNFIVVDKMEKIKTTRNRWTLNFSHRTVVICVQPIPELLAVEKLDDSQLLDIIGEVCWEGGPKGYNHKQRKGNKTYGGCDSRPRFNVDLYGFCVRSNNNLDCVFGDMVNHILSHLEDGRVEPLIVVLQFFKPSRWNDKVSIQSHFDVSKTRKRLTVNVLLAWQCKVSGHGVQSGAAELKQGGVIVKSIEDALNSTVFYKSCSKCPKKVETPIENRYKCFKCGHTHGSASLRYKVEVMAYDRIGSITMLIFPNLFNPYLGSVSEFLRFGIEVWIQIRIRIQIWKNPNSVNQFTIHTTHKSTVASCFSFNCGVALLLQRFSFNCGVFSFGASPSVFSFLVRRCHSLVSPSPFRQLAVTGVGFPFASARASCQREYNKVCETEPEQAEQAVAPVLVLCFQDVYHVVVNLGIDQAFVFGVVAILDYIYEWLKCDQNIEFGLNFKQPSASDKFGATPLLEAIKNGHEDVPTLLVNAGATLTIDDADNFLCVMVANLC